jgi:hypothetical protein
MRQIPDPLRELEALQYRPARRIQTVAAYFLAWKCFAFEHERLQAGGGAKGGTARARWPGADDCNVKEVHGVNETVKERWRAI